MKFEICKSQQTELKTHRMQNKNKWENAKWEVAVYPAKGLSEYPNIGFGPC